MSLLYKTRVHYRFHKTQKKDATYCETQMILIMQRFLKESHTSLSNKVHRAGLNNLQDNQTYPHSYLV